MCAMHQPRPQGAFPWLWRWGGKDDETRTRLTMHVHITNREGFLANLEEFSDIRSIRIGFDKRT